MEFSEKLIKLRKIKGLTQDEMASAVGVSRQAVYKWESGQSYPEVPKLWEIHLLFGISTDDLLNDAYEVVIPEKKKRRRKKAAEVSATEQPTVAEEKTETKEDESLKIEIPAVEIPVPKATADKAVVEEPAEELDEEHDPDDDIDPYEAMLVPRIKKKQEEEDEDLDDEDEELEEFDEATRVAYMPERDEVPVALSTEKPEEIPSAPEDFDNGTDKNDGNRRTFFDRIFGNK